MVTAAPAPLHPFEAHGLGKAPFQHVANGIGRTCCAYCGTHIVNQFHIESADGRQFVVGCECVKKTDDGRLISSVNRALRDMSLARKRERSRSPEQIARERCAAIIARYADRLAAIPANVPESVGPPHMLSWSAWMLKRGVAADLLRRLRSVLALDD